MHGRKLALNEVDKEKGTTVLILTVYTTGIYRKVFIYYNFPDTEVVIL